MSRVSEAIKRKINKMADSGCWRWAGPISKKGRPFLWATRKDGERAKIDIARRLYGEKHDLPAAKPIVLSRQKGCHDLCVNPDHHKAKLDRPAKKEEGGRNHDLATISKFKRAVKGGMSIEEARNVAGFCRSWAYKIAQGQHHADVEPKGAVFKRVRKPLSRERVKRVRELKKKNWTYRRIGKKLNIHPSTARDAYTHNRPGWV